MPRKRASIAPRYERAKLDTPEQINFEIKKAYRAYRNKKITAADLKNQRDTLVALRNGLPDPIERPGANGYVPPAIYILSVPSGYFLTAEQIAATRCGAPLVDIKQCELLQFDEPETIDEPEQPPQLPSLAQSEEATIAALKSEINALARKLGVSLVV